MKTYNTIYTSRKDLKEFIDKNILKDDYNAFSGDNDILVQVFSHLTDSQYIENVLCDIKYLLKNAKIIGSSTSGEIMDSCVMEKTTVISITVFNKTSVATQYVEYNNRDGYSMGVEIAGKLITSNTKVLILFSDGLLCNSEDLLQGIQSVNSDIIVSGGRASDYGYMKKTVCFNENKVMENGGLVGAALSGDDIIVNSDYNFCWQPIGKIMTVTKACGGRIYSIDNIPIRELYEKYLGKDVADSLPKSATEFPLIVYRDDVQIGRIAFSEYDDGSLGFGGNIKDGNKVSFGYGNVEMVTQKSLEIFDRLKLIPIESIFVYSCICRKVFMQKKIDMEMVPLNNFAPTAGFFTYGEFYHKNHENLLLNMTTTILCLSENNQIPSNYLNNDFKLQKTHHKDNFVDDKNMTIVKTLSHLTQTVTNELEAMNKSLELKNEELKEEQNKLIEIQRMSSLGILAAGIAHNLKSPLATISSSIITLNRINGQIRNTSKNTEKDYINYTDKIGELTQRIDSCINYMNNIILEVKEQTTPYGRISNSFTVGELVERIKVLISLSVKEAKCKLNFNVNTYSDTVISGDMTSLIQVVNNTISNAIDSYDGKGGIIELVVSVRNTGDNVKSKKNLVISVTDYGKGIDEGVKNKIFKKMITTKGTKGTGIGLFVSRSKIKSAFDGDITFNSEPGKSTTFDIVIPLQ